MFAHTSAFNTDVNGWDTGSVTDMPYMFSQASAFNTDVNGWDTGSVTDMSSMFFQASAFNRDANGWDTGSVTSMARMFSEATAFIGDVNGWNTGNVISMDQMFNQASKFNSDISAWSVAPDVASNDTFFEASAFDPTNVAGWTAYVSPTIFAPANCLALKVAIGEWFDDWFPGPLLRFGPISRWDVSRCTNFDGLFEWLTIGGGRNYDAVAYGVGDWDTAAVTSMVGPSLSRRWQGATLEPGA
jgi:surface protein